MLTPQTGMITPHHPPKDTKGVIPLEIVPREMGRGLTLILLPPSHTVHPAMCLSPSPTNGDKTCTYVLSSPVLPWGCTKDALHVWGFGVKSPW